MKKIIPVIVISCLILLNSFCSSSITKSKGNMFPNPVEITASIGMLFHDPVYYSMEYYLTNKKWPDSKEDIINYAPKNNSKISLNQFRVFYIEQSSGNRINIHFVTNQTGSDYIPFQNSKGIIGIYIEDINKALAAVKKDKGVFTVFTMGSYPYSDKTSITIDGYNVHIFIENGNPGSSNDSNVIMKNLLLTEASLKK